MSLKIFISYSAKNANKVKSLRRAFDKSTIGLEAIVVADRRDPGKHLSDKVKEGILETPYFIPILTPDSISTQWVNQEIGFATAHNRAIIPLVDTRIIKDLKGFLHNQVDLPFRYVGNDDNPRDERKRFRLCFMEMIEHLENMIKEFKATIHPTTLQKGDEYTTNLIFKGTLKNGFLDNYITHIGTGWSTYQWDRTTLKDGKPTTAGELHGQVEINKTFTHSTADWPYGKYNIYSRVYDHPTPGEPTRMIIAEEHNTLEILPENNLDKPVVLLPPKKMTLDSLTDGAARVKIFIERKWNPVNDIPDVEDFLGSIEISEPYCPACKADLIGRYDQGDVYNYFCPDLTCVNRESIPHFDMDTFKENVKSIFAGRVRRDFDKYWLKYTKQY